MKVVRIVNEVRACCRALPRPLGLVPTMGALHDGHLELVREARRRCPAVVASIFVNPLQFGDHGDLDAYPRDESRDLALLRREGAAAAFVPVPDEVYPRGFATTVHVAGPLSETLEGAVRPGHFDGVATVVAKLVGMVQPDELFLGEKDAQQLAVLRRALRDLDLPTAVRSVATVRAPDGLALSSRNHRLSPAERQAAPRLYAALRAGREVAGDVPAPAPCDLIVDTVHAALLSGPGEVHLAVDYVAVVDPDTFRTLDSLDREALLVAAVHIGRIRLIDNLRLTSGRPDPDHHVTTQEDPPR